MLKRKGLVTDRVIGLILSWRHTGFNVYCSDRIYPREIKSMENLARYIIRASFSQERMNYMVNESKVIYKSKNGNDTKEFDAVDFIASLCSHIPNKNEQMLRYLGFYSNVCRGRRKRQGACESDFVIEFLTGLAFMSLKETGPHPRHLLMQTHLMTMRKIHTFRQMHYQL